MIRLGHLVEDNSLVVDGETGAVLNWSEPEATLYPLNTDVSTLAFTLWLLHRERDDRRGPVPRTHHSTPTTNWPRR